MCALLAPCHRTLPRLEPPYALGRAYGWYPVSGFWLHLCSCTLQCPPPPELRNAKLLFLAIWPWMSWAMQRNIQCCWYPLQAVLWFYRGWPLAYIPFTYIYIHIDILVLASMHSESFKYIPDAHIIAAYPQQHFLQTMLSQLSAAWFSSNISQAKKNKENHMALQNPLSVCPWAFVKIHVYTPKNQKKAILVGKPLVFLVSCTRFMDNPMSRVCIDQSWLHIAMALALSCRGSPSPSNPKQKPRDR